MAEHGFLSRLRRDTRGNTIAIMAAALIPMLGLAGSAVDMTRLYVVKVRLQQACDAGVLAGRKFMSGNTDTLDPIAVTQANNFFANNFQNGWMSTSATAFTPSRTSNSQVSGVATTVVPMTIMKFFSFGNKALRVNCQARYDVPDIDVMFVLDTTGSMSCLPADSDAVCSDYSGRATKRSISRPSTSNQSLPKSSNGVAGYAGANMYGTTEKSNSRIEALRQAVLAFYDALDQAKDPQTKIRYGFVTYSSSVNAGQAILDVVPSYMTGISSGEKATYQSRQVDSDYTISYADRGVNRASAACKGNVTPRSPSAAQTYDTGTGTATQTDYFWDGNACQQRTFTFGPKWKYAPFDFDVSGVVAGGQPINPTKVRGQRMRWLGCVETKVDTPGQSSFTTTSLPKELDPDTTALRWVPQIQDLEYVRNRDVENGSVDYTNGDEGYYINNVYYQGWANYFYGSDDYATALDRNGNRVDSDADYPQKMGWVACGKPVKRLGEMTRADVNNYVYATDFVPMGGTYHDTGMIWGTRLISPTGPWATDTAPWPTHNPPNRVLVFLTDGDMSPTTNSYSMYGVEGYDKRVANGDTSNLTDYHNKRFLAECAAAKARNIDVWTVSIDTGVSTPLQSCATTNAQALATTSGSELGTIFQNIAKKLAMLRITQ